MRLQLNPDAGCIATPLSDGFDCLLIDNALSNPGEVLAYARQHRDAFRGNPDFYYPGIELPLPRDCYQELLTRFRREWRQYFGMGRPVQEHFSRLSLATLKPGELSPEQRVCHRDAPPPGTGMVIAGVLYLYSDSRLGGTVFFENAREPDNPEDEQRLLREKTEFMRNRSSYMTQTNDFYRRVLEVKPRMNRLALYPGHIYHSPCIEHPELLSADPLNGRLTVNIFMRGIRL